jgi:dihydroorotase (multifunctional complex type)
MNSDYLIHGNLVLSDKVVVGTVEISDEKIVSIRQEQKPPVASIPIIDATGKYILPGAIEVHGHMREPGDTHKEDYLTGTKAAIAGGVTTILDMPNTSPPTINQNLLQQKVQMALGRAYCDFGIILGASRDNFKDIETVDPNLIMGVKFFMAGHETTPTTMSSLGDLYKSFEILAQRNILALVHAENQQLIDYLSSKYMVGDNINDLAYSQARGEVVVDLAVWEAVRLARANGTKLYLCHLSTPSEMEALQWAKSHNQIVYGEVAAYHLMFNTDDYKHLGSRLKVSPAIRTPEKQAALWNYVFNNNLADTICSEHTPHLLTEKPNNILKASSGMPGIQEARAALITGFFDRELNNSIPVESFLVKLANLTSTNIAQIFGLISKGEIREGNDADLVIIDIVKRNAIKKDMLFSKCGWSPYEGKFLRGCPETTVLRGKIVYRNGQFIEQPSGKFLKHT